MSNTLNYIIEHGVEEALRHFEHDLKLKIKQDGSLLLLDYNQIESPRKHPIVDECRGVIIDLATKRYVCRTFDRFYNYGEYPELESAFDWNTASVIEKVDGSLIKVWYNIRDGRWEIATRGSLFGDNKITTLSGDEGEITFRQLFLRALGMTEHEWNVHTYNTFPCGYTLLFELCTIENKVVTSYDGDQVYFLGARNVQTGEEMPSLVEQIKIPTIRMPELYKAGNFTDAVKSANELGGLKEGFVIVDGKKRRLKIKSAAYVTAHHLRGEGVTPKRAVLLALAGEIPEFCSYFPEYLNLLLPYQAKVDRLRVEIVEVYDRYRNIEEQKEFALCVKDYPYSGVLFGMRKGFTAQEMIDKMNDTTKLAIFGV